MQLKAIFVLGVLAASFIVSMVVSSPAQAVLLSTAYNAALDAQTAKTGILYHTSNDAFTKNAERFVQKTADQAVSFLSDDSLSTAQKTKSFQRLLKNSFDMKTIGRFALGRNWRIATPAERKEYQALFEKMIIDIYSARFGEYQDQKVEVRKSRKDSEKDVTVTSFVLSKTGQEIQVDWRVRLKNGRYRVIDIVIEGVSMGLTHRSDFASVIQRGGGNIGVLLAHLRE